MSLEFLSPSIGLTLLALLAELLADKYIVIIPKITDNNICRLIF